ncbi:unnamed protein product [Camellia sinensis]
MMMVLTLFHPRLSFTCSAGDVGKALVIVVFKALFPSNHHSLESLGLVIAFRKNSEVLLVSSGNLVSYNPETKEKKNHGIHGIGYLFYVDTYVESLVLVRGSNGLSWSHEFVKETEQKRTATKNRKNRVCGYDGSSSSRLGSRERREWENVRSGGIVGK